MANKTEIENTIVNITKGKTKVDASIVDIVKGETKIDGSIYDILFEEIPETATYATAGVHTWTCPRTGYYKITTIGGGGGGCGGAFVQSFAGDIAYNSGGGGGSGFVSQKQKNLNKYDQLSITVGQGGAHLSEVLKIENTQRTQNSGDLYYLVSNNWAPIQAGEGENTSVVLNSNTICESAGGKGATRLIYLVCYISIGVFYYDQPIISQEGGSEDKPGADGEKELSKWVLGGYSEIGGYGAGGVSGRVEFDGSNLAWSVYPGGDGQPGAVIIEWIGETV